MTQHSLQPTESPFSDFGFPQRLEHYKARLNAAESAADCWDVFRELSEALGFEHVVFAHEFTDDGAERAMRFKWSSKVARHKAFANVRPPFDPVLLLKKRLSTPAYFGASFFRDPLHSSIFEAEEEARIHYAATAGWNSALALPLETHLRDGPTLIVLASALGRTDFLAMIRENGWLIHVLSLEFARVYLSHVRRDAVQKIGLTARQRELLHLTALGYSTKQIAHVTGVTEQAVSKTMRKISSHFGTATRVGIVARAAQLGMFDDPSVSLQDK